MSINLTNVSKQCRGVGCPDRMDCERFHSYYMRERKPFEEFFRYAKDKHGRCRYKTPAVRDSRALAELRTNIRLRHKQR